MARILSILVGLFFTVALAWSFVLGAITAATEPAPATAEHEFHLHPKEVRFSFDGPFGKFDNQQLQRGFQVYKEVCAACHSMEHLAYRHLGDPGGPGFNEAEVKAMPGVHSIHRLPGAVAVAAAPLFSRKPSRMITNTPATFTAVKAV